MKITLLSFLFFIAIFYPTINYSKSSNMKSLNRSWRTLALADLEKLNISVQLQSKLSEADYNHLLWLAKTSRLLRGGRELTKADDVSLLLKKTKSEITDLFLNRPTFYDSLLDFNLYFMGFGVDAIIDNNTYSANAFSNRLATHAALAQAHGQGVEALLNFYPKAIVFPLNEPDISSADTYGIDHGLFDKATPKERRHLILQSVITSLEDIGQKLDQKTIDLQGACQFFSKQGTLTSTAIAIGITGDLQNYLMDPAMNVFYGECYTQVLPQEVTFVKVFKNLFIDIADRIDAFDESTYHPTNLTEFRVWPGIQPPPLAFQNFSFSTLLVNSSTNYSRRRAAFFLKHYFCDDLTPVNVEVPAEHTGGPHGSDSSCYSCHYKLDPMAGFFKNYGVQFNNFSDFPKIFFDDNAQMDINAYQSAWLAPAGSGRKWNIGYIRSEKEPKLNSYGESIDDLSTILKESYEFKRCFVQRAFQYATDASQMMDPGFIEAVSRDFEKENKTNPTGALKNLFKQVALSKTFTEEDRESNTCYDLDPQSIPGVSSPPCQVRFILKTNCVMCHDAHLALSNLDLSSWVPIAGGSFGFPHFDLLGNQIPRKNSFDMILDRITTTKTTKRMPQKMHMDPAHREQLYKWLHEQNQ